jgi:hypothetical protein
VDATSSSDAAIAAPRSLCNFFKIAIIAVIVVIAFTLDGKNRRKTMNRTVDVEAIKQLAYQFPNNCEEKCLFVAMCHFLNPEGTRFFNYPEVMDKLIAIYGHPVPIDGKKLRIGCSYVWEEY